MPMRLSDLIRRVTDDRIIVEPVSSCMTHASPGPRRDIIAITLNTMGVSMDEIAGLARARNVGLLIWMPTELANAAKTAPATPSETLVDRLHHAIDGLVKSCDCDDCKPIGLVKLIREAVAAVPIESAPLKPERSRIILES